MADVLTGFVFSSGRITVNQARPKGGGRGGGGGGRGEGGGRGGGRRGGRGGGTRGRELPLIIITSEIVKVSRFYDQNLALFPGSS